MANVGVTFDFAAESAKLRTEIDKVRKELSSINAAAKGIKDGFKLVGTAIAGAFSLGAITSFLRAANASADALNDMAERMNVSASGLQSMQLAAQMAGGSAEGLNNVLTKMSQTIGEAAGGQKQAVEAFNKLGLSIAELASMKGDEAFKKIADALKTVPNTFERAALAQDVFGKGVKEVAALVAQGSAAIDEVTESLKAQGAALSDIDIARIGQMNDELQFQTTVVTNLGAKFLSGLAPAVSVATSAVANMIGKIGGATDAGEGFGVVLTAVVKIAETLAYAFAMAFEGVRSVIAGVAYVIASAIQNMLQGAAFLAEKLNLDVAAPLRSASDTFDNIADSLDNVSRSATINAKNAGAAAIQAGLEIVKAGEIFAKAKADYDAQAAEAAARNSAAQGTTVIKPVEGPADKAAKEKADKDLSAASLANLGRTSLLLNDPLTDPRFLLEQSVQSAITDLTTSQSAQRLAFVEQTNKDILDSFLLRNDILVAAEEAKNMTLGDMMGELVQMGLQQGGAMGKFAKAYAIAQTVWSTGQAVMRTMASVPYPMNIAAAAMIAAKGALQLANIKKTNVGSGGSIAGAGGGGTAVAASVPEGTQRASTESEQKTATQIIINGSLFAAQETVDWLVTQIGEAVNGRDLVFINGNSRQAMELVGA